MQLELSKEYLERLQLAIEEQDAQFITESMEGEHPADITQVLYELDTPSSKYVIDQLPHDVSAQIVSGLDSETRRKFLKVFESTEVAALMPHMDSDDAVDILDELPVRFREEVIALIDDPEMADHIIELLHYEDDCAGGLMAKELIKANANWTVNQCIEEIRRQAENVDKIFSVYVVDDNDRLLGRVSIKQILLSKSNTKIADIYEKDVVSVESYLDVDEVVEVMQKYDLEAVPVVNIQNRLLGRITIDDIVDVITEQKELDQQIMAGISENVEVDDSVWASSRARLPWLLIGMAGGLAGAQLMDLFGATRTLIPAMTIFVPLITATGGNVGIQSSTVIIQTIANKSFLGTNFVHTFFRMMLVALVNAIVIGGLVFGFLMLWGQPLQLSMLVTIALFSVVVLASVMGTVTPIVLDKFGVNPALASGPFITTANDLLGLTVYFSVAHLLIKVFG